MKKYLLILKFLFVLTLFSSKITAQSKFYKRYANFNIESFPITEKTADGGFVVCSSIYQYSQQTWLFKYDACGDLQWNKNFPGFSASDLVVCKNGDMVLSSSNNTVPELLRLDSNGNMIWRNTYTTGAYSFCVYSTGEFTNGDLFFNGIAEMQMNGPYYNFIVKTNSAGTIKWNKYYYPFYYSAWGLAIPCSDGGVLSRTADESFKTDSSGNIEWAKSFTGTSFCFKPIEVSDGFVFARYGEVGGSDTGFVYKTDKLGNLLWAGDRFNVNYITKISRLPNGHFIMIGSLKIDPSEYRFLPTIIETDSLGKFIYQQTYNPNVPTANSYHGDGFCLLDDSSLVFTGKERYFNQIPYSFTTWLYVAKTAKMHLLGCGDSVIQQYYSPIVIHPVNYSLSATDINFTKYASSISSNITNPGEEIICSGYDTLNFKLPLFEFLCRDSTLILNAPKGNYEYLWSTGTTSEALTVTHSGIYGLHIIDPCIHDTIYTFTLVVPQFDCSLSITENSITENIHLFPNPSSGKFTIQSSDPSTPLRVTSVAITNLLGEKVYSTQFPQSTQLTINLSDKPKGIYFVEMISENTRETKKIILE